MNHSTAMDLIREANPVPNPAGMERRQRKTSGWIGKLALGVLAALVFGAGASWAATGQSPIDLFTDELADQGASPAFIESVERDADTAPPGTQPGPITEPGEVRVPQGEVADPLVRYCMGLQNGGVDLAERNPQCAALLLKDAGIIQGGVYESDHIEDRYQEWGGRQ